MLLRSVLLIALVGLLSPLVGACAIYAVYKEQQRESALESREANVEREATDPWSIYAAASTDRIFQSLYLVGHDGMARPRVGLSASELNDVGEWLTTVRMDLDDIELKKWRLPKLGLVSTKVVDNGAPIIKVGQTKIVTVDVAAIRAIHTTLSNKYFGGLANHADYFRRVNSRDKRLVDEMSSHPSVGVDDSRHLDIQRWPAINRQLAFFSALRKSVEFVLLHEVAHVELNHLAIIRAVSPQYRCGELRAIELEADEFASLYIDKQPGGISESMTEGRPFEEATFGASIGRKISLVDSKELHAGGEDAYGCKYPMTEVRQAHIQKVLSGARNSSMAMSPRVRERFCRENNPSICSAVEGHVPRAVEMIKQEQQD